MFFICSLAKKGRKARIKEVPFSKTMARGLFAVQVERKYSTKSHLAHSMAKIVPRTY